MVIPLLSICRSLDANTMTNWRWVFPAGRILPVFFLLFPAIIAAYILSRFSVRGAYAPLFLSVICFASILPLWNEPETIIDASRYFVQAKAFKEYGLCYFIKEWGYGIGAWTDLPLIPFLYGTVFSALGEKRVCIQALNSLLFTGTGVLIYLIGKKLWDEETGLHAGLLLLGIPYLLIQVPLMLVDVPAMFFLTLAVYASLALLDKGSILRIAGLAAALLLALLCKYSIWPMLSVIAVVFFVYYRSEPKVTVSRYSAVLLLAGLAAVVLLAFRAQLLHDQLAILRTYQWSGLKRWNEGWVSEFLFQTHPFVTGFALVGMYRAAVKKDARFLIPGCFLVLTVLLQIKRMRYLIPLLPLFGLMASYGLNQITDSGSRRFIALCIAASSLVIVYAGYVPFLNRTSFVNLRDAGQYLNTLNASSIEVYALPQQSSSGSTFPAIPILDYYTEKEIVAPQNWPTHAADGKISSMRFTWEMKKPAFYSDAAHENAPVIVLISDMPADNAARGFGPELKRFDLADPFFKYQTAVVIYRKQ